jgi:hypothetical protein
MTPPPTQKRQKQTLIFLHEKQLFYWETVTKYNWKILQIGTEH